MRRGHLVLMGSLFVGVCETEMAQWGVWVTAEGQHTAAGCVHCCAKSSWACWIWWQAQFASLLQRTSEKVKRSCNTCGNALFSLSCYNDFLKRAWKEAFLELITACGLALITGELRQCSIHVWINITEVSLSLKVGSKVTTICFHYTVHYVILGVWVWKEWWIPSKHISVVCWELLLGENSTNQVSTGRGSST